MKDVNKVILIGRLGMNPIQRETKNGTPVVNFSLATSRRVTSEAASGEGEEKTEVTQWHRIVAWGKQGEACARNLRKGASVYVEGSMRSHSYSDKEGKQKLSFEVYAENVSFLGGPRRTEEVEETSEHQAESA